MTKEEKEALATAKKIDGKPCGNCLQIRKEKVLMRIEYSTRKGEFHLGKLTQPFEETEGVVRCPSCKYTYQFQSGFRKGYTEARAKLMGRILAESGFAELDIEKIRKGFKIAAKKFSSRPDREVYDNIAAFLLED